MDKTRNAQMATKGIQLSYLKCSVLGSCDHSKHALPCGNNLGHGVLGADVQDVCAELSSCYIERLEAGPSFMFDMIHLCMGATTLFIETKCMEVPVPPVGGYLLSEVKGYIGVSSGLKCRTLHDSKREAKDTSGPS